MTQGVYVLELNDGTRYVGSSHNIEERINQHKEGTGSTITKEKGVKGLLDLITKKKKDLIQWEKKETIAQMVKHGFNKVRGFQWTSSKNLSNNDAYMLKQLILGEYSLCYKCGKKGHLANKCEEKDKAKWLKEIEDILNETKVKQIVCFKCNRPGHYANKCPLQNMYSSYTVCYDDSSDEEDSYYSNKVKCYNCGKFGHYASNCYSKKKTYYKKKYYDSDSYDSDSY